MSCQIVSLYPTYPRQCVLVISTKVEKKLVEKIDIYILQGPCIPQFTTSKPLCLRVTLEILSIRWWKKPLATYLQFCIALNKMHIVCALIIFRICIVSTKGQNNFWSRNFCSIKADIFGESSISEFWHTPSIFLAFFKGGLYSESVSLWLKSPKKGAESLPWASSF